MRTTSPIRPERAVDTISSLLVRCRVVQQHASLPSRASLSQGTDSSDAAGRASGVPLRYVQGEGSVRVTRTFNKEVFHAKKHAPVARSHPFKSRVHLAAGPQKTERGENHGLRARGGFGRAREQGGPPLARVFSGRTGLSGAASGQQNRLAETSAERVSCTVAGSARHGALYSGHVSDSCQDRISAKAG